jgi:chitinase
MPYVDFVNIMTYDLVDGAPWHQAGLYRSKFTRWESADESVNMHLKAGVPMDKLTLGMPFYGRQLRELLPRGQDNAVIYRDIIGESWLKNPAYIRQWDDVAKAAWLSDKEGNFVLTYEEPRAIAYKCEFLHSKGMLGAMYWSYSGDDTGMLRKAIHDGVMKIK